MRVELAATATRSSCDDPEAIDVVGHGTACAGIIHAIAPGADLVSVRVLGPDNRGKGIVFAAGLDWAIEHGATVVNLSLSSKSDALYGTFHDLADRAYFANVLLVCAANNVPGPSYPSLFAAVVSVAAHDVADAGVWFYNPDPPVEFGAYGVDVDVAWRDGGRMVATGNSFAAPHIAGLRDAHPVEAPGGVTRSRSRRSSPRPRRCRPAPRTRTVPWIRPPPRRRRPRRSRRVSSPSRALPAAGPAGAGGPADRRSPAPGSRPRRARGGGRPIAAVTVAVRGTPRRSPISPKTSPGPIVRRCSALRSAFGARPAGHLERAFLDEIEAVRRVALRGSRPRRRRRGRAPAGRPPPRARRPGRRRRAAGRRAG